MKTVFVAWQNPKTRKWFTVGRLTERQGEYEFVYTKGALSAGEEFIPFGRFRKLGSRYVSKELFPLFANRTFAENRQEYQQFLEWLGLKGGTTDPIEVLARSGGRRATDTLEIFPYPIPNPSGQVEFEFFVHGVRYLPPETMDRISGLQEGTRLCLMFDVQNPVDPKAVAIRTENPPLFLGYCPRYLAYDLRHLLWPEESFKDAGLSVLRVNEDAPLQYRLLCRFTAKWPKEYVPCSGEEYQPIDGSATTFITSYPHIGVRTEA